MAEDALIEQLNQAIDAMLAGAKQTATGDATLSPLIEIAATLLDMPDDRFKMQLRRELQTETQRRTPMTVSTPIESRAAGGSFPRRRRCAS